MINYENGRNFASTLTPELIQNPGAFQNWCNHFISALKAPAEEKQVHPTASDTVIIFTDGACSGNPGPGGFGAILSLGEHRREISGGEEHTTNNRMELLGVIHALEALKRPVPVVVYTDSTYVQSNYPRLEKWQQNGWTNASRQPVMNSELWQRLQKAVSDHCVTIAFEKVKGHSGHPENERCDQLARDAAARFVKTVVSE